MNLKKKRTQNQLKAKNLRRNNLLQIHKKML
jgi:hypothetical protein